MRLQRPETSRRSPIVLSRWTPGGQPPLVSGLVHQGVEPLVGALGVSGLVHDLNCNVVEPVEDLVDAITIPIVNGLNSLLGGVRLF